MLNFKGTSLDDVPISLILLIIIKFGQTLFASTLVKLKPVLRSLNVVIDLFDYKRTLLNIVVPVSNQILALFKLQCSSYC